MSEVIDYTPEVNHLVESGVLTPSELVEIPYPGSHQGDSILAREFSGNFTVRIYNLQKRYYTRDKESSTYLTATIDTSEENNGIVVPFAYKKPEQKTNLLLGLISQGDYPNGSLYQPNWEYRFGTVLGLGTPPESIQLWYPNRAIPLSELSGVRMSQAIFHSASPKWESFLKNYISNTDPDQNLSIEAQVAILNALAKNNKDKYVI